MSEATREKCGRSGCPQPAYKQTELCYACYRRRDYGTCTKCGEPCHRRSASRMCSKCYWEWRRAESPYTGMSKKEYDAQRYEAVRRRASHLRAKYGITLEQYEEMYRSQEGKCPVCLLPFNEAKLTYGLPVVDHCHKTGKVRGLLCDPCNRGLGQFKDDRDIVARAVEYLDH